MGESKMVLFTSLLNSASRNVSLPSLYMLHVYQKHVKSKSVYYVRYDCSSLYFHKTINIFEYMIGKTVICDQLKFW